MYYVVTTKTFHNVQKLAYSAVECHIIRIQKLDITGSTYLLYKILIINLTVPENIEYFSIRMNSDENIGHCDKLKISFLCVWKEHLWFPNGFDQIRIWKQWLKIRKYKYGFFLVTFNSLEQKSLKKNSLQYI